LKQLIVSGTPELNEVLFFLLLGLFIFTTLLYLMLSGLLNGILELQTLSLSLFEYFLGLFFRLGNLLV
jgi:hypothetical protein